MTINNKFLKKINYHINKSLYVIFYRVKKCKI